MAKRPEPPNPGDRVRKRGFQHLGTVSKVAPLGVLVAWDDGAARDRPTYCSAGELEVVRGQEA